MLSPGDIRMPVLVGGVGERVEHWFNRRYGVSRRDVYLLRTPTGWQVLGRGGADGAEVVYYFDDEQPARGDAASHAGHHPTRGIELGQDDRNTAFVSQLWIRPSVPSPRRLRHGTYG
jgi:hypothetical protein